MLNIDQGEDDVEEDDVSFYVQRSQSTMLKTVSGSNSAGNHADERTRILREAPAGSVHASSIAAATDSPCTR